MRMLRLKDAQIHRARIVCWALDEIRSDSHTTTRRQTRPDSCYCSDYTTRESGERTKRNVSGAGWRQSGAGSTGPRVWAQVPCSTITKHIWRTSTHKAQLRTR